MKKLTFDKFCEIMTEEAEKRKKTGEAAKIGYIVYKSENWNTNYSLKARTYKVSSDAKFFNVGLIGNSLFGTSLDLSDVCVRLDWYNWEVDYCYF